MLPLGFQIKIRSQKWGGAFHGHFTGKHGLSRVNMALHAHFTLVSRTTFLTEIVDVVFFKLVFISKPHPKDGGTISRSFHG